MGSNWPLSTGAVFRLLGVPEHRLTVLIRLGKLDVPLVCGRRAWGPNQVLRAAKLVGQDSPAIRNLCQSQINAGPEHIAGTINMIVCEIDAARERGR